MSENIFVELNAEYEFLSRVEQKIADYILNSPDEFINFSMSELSRLADVSQGSINNFAKKFSSGGFSALKLKIAACIASRNDRPFTVVDKTQGVKAAMELKIKENLTAFENTLMLNSEDSLKKAVDMILKAKKTEIYGVFQSGIIANDFYYQLIQLGIPASFVGDSLMCSVSASMLDSDCLVVAVSSSGRTKEVIDAVKIAKENNVPIICITANKLSPLAEMSDVALFAAKSGMSISDQSAEIRLSQILVLDTLCSYIRSLFGSGNLEDFYKLRSILSSHNIAD